MKSVIYLSDDIVQVWTKEKPSKDMKEKYIQVRIKSRLSINGWKKLNEVMTFQEVNCFKRTSKTIKTVFYDNDGNELDLVTYPNPEPFQIIPNSMGEILFNGICPRVKKK